MVHHPVRIFLGDQVAPRREHRRSKVDALQMCRTPTRQVKQEAAISTAEHKYAPVLGVGMGKWGKPFFELDAGVNRAEGRLFREVAKASAVLRSSDINSSVYRGGRSTIARATRSREMPAGQQRRRGAQPVCFG